MSLSQRVFCSPPTSHPTWPGLLLGLGDTRHDVLHGLACLATLHRRYGHIQVRAEEGEAGLPPCRPYALLLLYDNTLHLCRTRFPSHTACSRSTLVLQ